VIVLIVLTAYHKYPYWRWTNLHNINLS